MTTTIERPTFIDLFAGCGGLSLGLMSQGWQGLFAVEREQMAFHTLVFNLLYNPKSGMRFHWPEWLPPYPLEIQSFRRRFVHQIRALKGNVTLIAGGPPCQGFSFAGRRDKDDPRNRLFESYFSLVKEIRPIFVLFENVPGIRVPHTNGNGRSGPGRPAKSFESRVLERLRASGYHVYEPEIVRAQDYGVPQFRPRLFILGIADEAYRDSLPNPYQLLEKRRSAFLRRKGIPQDRPVSVAEAIGDLLRSNGCNCCTDLESPRGFLEGVRSSPKSAYQRIMAQETSGSRLTGHRFVRHEAKIERRFAKILSQYRRGVQLSSQERAALGLKKNSIVPLAGDKPAHTLTTLPDDLIHYSEPRILTVREYARLQSFPDWYNFRGKFTTGGTRRKAECPRYTQIGNAVPPLLAEAWAGVLLSFLEEIVGINGLAQTCA